MNRQRTSSAVGDLLSNPILVGSMMLIVTVMGVLLSYNANKGLPFVPTYQIFAEVPDAAKLTAGGSEARIGGARVGLVKEIDPLPAQDGKPVRARLLLDLQEDQSGLPVDTEVRVRPRSILGSKFLDIIPGKSKQTIPPGGTIPIEQVQPIVELEEAFNIFDDETSQGLRTGITNLGDALAGRGADLNETVAEVAKAMPPAQRVLGVLADPTTELEGFIKGVAATSRALEPVAPQLSSMLSNGATTLEAVSAASPALGEAIEELPRLNVSATTALRAARPVLVDAGTIAKALRPGTRYLPTAARGLTSTLKTATPVLGRSLALSKRLRAALTSLGKLAGEPTAAGTVRLLTTTVSTLDRTLQTLLPVQKTCNTLGVLLRNFSSAVSTGNVDGSTLLSTLILDPDQVLQRGTPAPNLHTNPAPLNNGTECETGNEPFVAGLQRGNPAGTQPARTEDTAPPAAATARAARAGLLKGIGR
jgi:virulence factor Mce-like protein